MTTSIIPTINKLSRILLLIFFLSTIAYAQKNYPKETIYIKFDFKENTECLEKNRKSEAPQEDFIKTILHSKVETSTSVIFKKCNSITFYYQKVDEVLPTVVDYKSLNLIDFNSKSEFIEQLKPYKKRDFYIVEILGKEKAYLYKVHYKVNVSH